MGEVYRDTQLTVGTSVVIACEDLFDNDRIEFSLVNVSTGTQQITLAVDSEAVIGKGRTIGPGGYWTASEDTGFKPTKKRITAISDQAGALLAVSERIRVKDVK